VIWKRRIAIVVLAVLAALPLAGIVCAMLCGSAAAAPAVAHHRAGSACSEQSGPPAGPQLRAATLHDCARHDAGVRRVTTMATRADSIAAPGPSVVVPGHPILQSLDDSDVVLDYRPPPGTLPVTSSPLVLRV
jgi:hypothetical protein